MTCSQKTASGSSMFIRWGRSVCPSRTGAELVYEGMFKLSKKYATKEDVKLNIVVIVLNISVQPKYKEQ